MQTFNCVLCPGNNDVLTATVSTLVATEISNVLHGVYYITVSTWSIYQIESDLPLRLTTLITSSKIRNAVWRYS